MRRPRICKSRRRARVGDKGFYANILTDRMSPRYKIGERAVYITSLSPKVGDDVLVVLRDGSIDIHRLIAFDGKTARLLQWRGFYTVEEATKIEVPLDQIAEIYPVIGAEVLQAGHGRPAPKSMKSAA